MSARRKRAATPPTRNKKQKAAVPVVDDAKAKTELRALFGPKNPNYQFPVCDRSGNNPTWKYDSVFVWNTRNSLCWHKERANAECRANVALIFGGMISPFVRETENFTKFFGVGTDWLPVLPLVDIILDYISIRHGLETHVEDVESNKGDGLFAAYDLEPGTVVAPYVGEILSGIKGGEYCLSHRGLSRPTDDDVVYEKEDYTINGRPSYLVEKPTDGFQVASYANEPDVGKTENCSIVPVRIPGVAFEILCLVVTARVNAFDELTFHYGPKYNRYYFDSRSGRSVEYKVGRESGIVVPPVSLSFEQTMVILWMYERFNTGFFSSVFEKFGVGTVELMAIVARLMR